MIKLDDNTKIAKDELEKAIESGLLAMGLHWQAVCTQIVTNEKIVDTGRLRASLSFVTPTKAVGGDSVASSEASDELYGTAPAETILVGSNVEYAAAVNNGTATQRSRNFLDKSLELYADEYKKILMQNLTGVDV